MTVKVTGNLERDCLIILQQNNIPDSLALKRKYVLKEGMISDTLSKDDLYGDSAKITFKHGKNNNGYLNLEVVF